MRNLFPDEFHMGLAAPVVDLIFDGLDNGLLTFFRDGRVPILSGHLRKRE